MTSSVVCVAVGNKMKALGQVLLPPRPSVTAFNINNAQNVGQLTVDLLFFIKVSAKFRQMCFSPKKPAPIMILIQCRCSIFLGCDQVRESYQENWNIADKD